MPKPSNPTPIYLIVDGGDKAEATRVARSKGVTLAQWLRELIKFGIKRDKRKAKEAQP